MRIVTRPDFDGVVCALLLKDVLGITSPVLWVQPNDMQRGLVTIRKNDIIANLPYHENCSLWFDHHYSNRIDNEFEGSFEIAPSAAGVVFDYYGHQFSRDFSSLIRETDKIDSADLTLDEILHPERYPCILLSMTVSGHDGTINSYSDRLVDLLGTSEVDSVLDDHDVRSRCDRVIEENKIYREFLLRYTKQEGQVSITDFRSLKPAPDGNRFLVYSLLPDTVVNVKIIHDKDDMAIIKVGHSIINRHCHVNVGKMLSAFEGGGHRGAGACRFKRDKTDNYLSAILDILQKNDPDE
ncbi:MAG: exopolyphosphatase [Desulfobacteraceae bacterium]|nr:exopolyphosphatase [Desulfobacteraceae bacterium]